MIRRLPSCIIGMTASPGGGSCSSSCSQAGPTRAAPARATQSVIVSGTEGGSAETNHPGGSTKAYIPKMINLLARTLPFKIEVVCENGTFEPFYTEQDHFTKTGSGQT
jgi:hypothetical protein